LTKLAHLVNGIGTTTLWNWSKKNDNSW